MLDEYKYPKQFMDEKLFSKATKEIIKNFSTLNNVLFELAQL